MEAKHLLLWVSVTNHGHWPDMYETIKNKVKPHESNEEIDRRGAEFEGNYSTILDDDYPLILKQTTDGTVPFVLYYDGNFDLIQNGGKKLAIVGTTKSSKYGEKMVSQVISEVTKVDVVVVSYQKGIATVALKEALKKGIKTIVVLNTSLKDAYEKDTEGLLKQAVEQDGLVITEYPEGTIWKPELVRWSLRIIASISNVILLGEEYSRSATSIVIGYGINFGKDIGAIPFPAGLNSLNNDLIKEGANLIQSGQDIDDLLN